MSKPRIVSRYGANKTVRCLRATAKSILAVMAVTTCKEIAAFQIIPFVAKHHVHTGIPFFGMIGCCPVVGVPKTKTGAVRGHCEMNNCNECGELRSSVPFRFLSTVKRRLVGRRRIRSIVLRAKGSSDASSGTEAEVSRLRQENEILKNLVAELEEENKKLESRPPQRIVIETFEGEGRPMLDANGEEIPSWFEAGEQYFGEAEVILDEDGGATVATTWELEKASDREESRSTVAEDSSCDEYDEDACPIEPNLSFTDALRDRAYWLVGLLAMQSMSGFILARNEELLQSHPVIVYFLTMLVGAGGNAGNQASVRVIRGLALGTLNEQTQRRFLNREFKMALSLSTVLSFAGFARAAVFRTPFAETVAVTTSLCLIVFSSICLGAILPLFLKRLGVDPAHSSTTIQVVMDILGVVMTVIVSTTLLDSPIGQALIAKLSWGQ